VIALFEIAEAPRLCTHFERYGEIESLVVTNLNLTASAVSVLLRAVPASLLGLSPHPFTIHMSLQPL
jgi:hypothetical protein